MANIPAIKAANDVAVTNKVAVNSITPADEGNRLNAITDELRPYKVYSFIISQTGFDAPVVIELENTIGELEWSSDGEGIFILSGPEGTFPRDKTFLFPSMQTKYDEGFEDSIQTVTFKVDDNPTGTENVYIRTYVDGVLEGGVLDTFSPGVAMEARVYP